MPSVEYPALLWLLALLPLLWLKNNVKPVPSKLNYSDISLFDDLPSSVRQKWTKLVPLLYLLALVFLIIACAQPFIKKQHYSEQTQGIAISIVIDVSTSMDFQMDSNGERQPRMEVAKKALSYFVLGDGEKLTGRASDLISVITFARYPDTLVPLTSAHEALVDMTNEITTSSRPNEDGTAFGDATALAAAQLNHYESSLGLKSDSIKNKVIILLTDGENNSGSYDPLMAAALAKKWGIKIYTISIADLESNSLTTDSGDSLQLEQTMVSTDWTLQAMAETTGGTFQRAYNYQSLQKVYQEINALETSSLQRVVFEERQPAFHLPILLAILCLFLAHLLNATWLRIQG